MMPPPPLLSRGRRPQTDGRAFALVIVLIIVSVLALVAVGYLSSMSQERATANAFGNKTRAEQSAQAGVDTAMGTLRDYFKAFPDSATVWEAQSKNPGKQPADPDYSNDGTSLYFRAVPDASGSLPNPIPNPADTSANSTTGNDPNNVNASGVDNRKVFVLPLASGATPVLQANRSLATSTTDGYTDLNSRRSLTDNQGQIGTLPTYTYPSTPNLPKPVRVPWVEIKQQDGIATGGTAPVVSRYAFWIEDESFRANVSYADGRTDASGNFVPNDTRRDNTTNATLNSTDMSLLGLFTSIGGVSPTTGRTNLLAARGAYPGKVFPEASAYAHAVGLPTAVSNGLRYLTTTQSTALNLSRHGTQRLNLNAVIPVTTATVTSAPDVSVAQRQIGKIVKAISFHAPNFGQRFYRTAWTGSPAVPSSLNALNVSSANATIYLNKIAANVRDYMDSDSLPTVIMPSVNASPNDNIGQVRANSRPTTPINFIDGANPVWAFGKDAAPFLSESAVRLTGSSTASSYTVNVDYYIEVWNMSTQPVTGQSLGPNAYIRVINPPKWMGDIKANAAGTPTSLSDGSGHTLSDTRDVAVPGRDFDIDISNATFPPGVCTVITTDPGWSSAVSPTDGTRSIADPLAANQTEATKHFIVCPFISPGKRIYTGSFPTTSSGAVCNEVRMRYDSSSSSDYETEIVMGNDYGYIDSLGGAVPMNGGIISMPVGSSPRPVYGGYMRGNLASGAASGGLQPSALGDPRANNEQLSFTLHVPTTGSPVNPADQTGFKNFDLTSNSAQIPPTFGLPNIYGIAPPKSTNPWPDYYWFPGNDSSHTVTPNLTGSSSTAVMKAQNAPAVIANSALTSIGQLGDIYDPARLPATSGGNINDSHGGGRTLRIGQHDDLSDVTTVNSASMGWASWRLVDFFGTSDNVELPGLININGLARDNGIALQAAYRGLVFQPVTSDYGSTGYDPLIHGDTSLAGVNYSTTTGLQNLIADMIANRLKNSDPTKINPFYERGEMSETPILNPANYAGTSFAGAVTSTGGTNIDMRTVFDHGREELMRRLLEMTTTRGNVFTVYAIGQAINQTNPSDATTKRVLATQQLRVTFKLVPKTSTGASFHPGTDDSGKPIDFDPTDATQLSTRFSKPDHYDIQVLSTSSGNN